MKLSVGVWDALSARLAERAGFELLFLSGFALAGTQLGEPDFGLLTQTETLDAARRITAAVRTPLVVDGDTGHGGPQNAQRLVRELVRIGAAGVLLGGHDDAGLRVAPRDRGVELVTAVEVGDDAEVAGVLEGGDQVPAFGRPGLVDDDGRDVAHVGLDRVAEEEQLDDREPGHDDQGEPVAPHLDELLAEHRPEARHHSSSRS